jgi:hypothetical protein
MDSTRIVLENRSSTSESGLRQNDEVSATNREAQIFDHQVKDGANLLAFALWQQPV